MESHGLEEATRPGFLARLYKYLVFQAMVSYILCNLLFKLLNGVSGSHKHLIVLNDISLK